MSLIEERAHYFSVWTLKELIFEESYYEKISDYLHTQSVSSYPNIIKILGNKDDPNYRKCYISDFKKLLNSEEH